MKYLAVLVCLLFFIKNGTTDRIVIHTSDQIGTLYQFFPLRTNLLQFSVKAKNDVHISLTNMPALTGAYYEIAIGGWGNTKSVIRKDNGNAKVEHVGPAVNQNDFQTYWVSINDTQGSISVGKRIGDFFMYYKDPDYVKMSYFGISTGFGSTGDWNFDSGMFSCDYWKYNESPMVNVV